MLPRMAERGYHVFLSAVTSEFGAAREAVAADLRARGLTVKVQRDFRHESGAHTTLDLLHNYIAACDRVVCIIGTRSGTVPQAYQTSRYEHMLPDGIAEASYTQWEFLFARAHRKQPFLFVAGPDYKPEEEPADGERPDLQTAFRDHITQTLGLNYRVFATTDGLRAEVLKLDWPRLGKPIVLPYPTLGTLFKGRDDFLRQMRASLVSAGQAAIVSQAVLGLGGIGKTRAAVEYAWAHRDDYTSLLFAVGDSPEALRRNLAALSGVLLPDFDAREDEARLRAVLDWLNANPGWLLILDNLDTAAALTEAEAVLARLAGGHVVMTTRKGNLPAGIDPLDLGLLALEDSASFLLARTPQRQKATDDDAQARALAGELGQLALALEHAGAYIARRRLGFAAYRALWRENREKALDWSDPALTHYPRAIAVTWQTSVAQLSPSARVLLERLAFLAPDPVPLFLLDVPVPAAEAADWPEALDDLVAWSLATRVTIAMRHGEQPGFAVHRLVQDVTRRSLGEENKRQRLTETLGWINAAFTGDPPDVRSWPRLDPLAPHAEAVAWEADKARIAAPTARLMGELAVLLNAKARHREAEKLSRRALEIDEASFGTEHPDVAIDLNNLAQLLQDTNRLAEAEPLMRRALAIDEASFGTEHPNVATDLNNLARLLQATNRLAEAEPLSRRHLAIFFAFEAQTGHPHPHRNAAIGNYAALLAAMGRGEARIRRTIEAIRRP